MLMSTSTVDNSKHVLSADSPEVECGACGLIVKLSNCSHTAIVEALIHHVCDFKRSN